MDCTNIEAGEELSTNCFSVHDNNSKFMAIAVNNIKFVPGRVSKIALIRSEFNLNYSLRSPLG